MVCPECQNEIPEGSNFCPACGHAKRACYAALAIQHALTPYSRKLKEDYGIDFKMRIGLNSGDVVVGSIGDDLRMDYTAQGDTANLAARMQSCAEPGAEQQILKGIALLEELKNKSHSSLGVLWLGEVYAEAGRHDAALKMLKKAEILFREMGMDYWLGKAQEVQAKNRAEIFGVLDCKSPLHELK
jgi:tetratricopeptide (TPR) repeat protein